MIQWIMFFMMFTFNFTFFLMKHPLAMGLTLLIQTMLFSLSSGLISKTFWFAYILFLVFIGGLMVLFIYITSLASNEMFSLSIKLSMSFIMMLFLTTSIFMFMDKNLLMQYKNTEILSMFNLNSYIMENSLMINKLYNYPTNFLTLLLMNYLLITLIAIVKITKLFEGPLRPMFN